MPNRKPGASAALLVACLWIAAPAQAQDFPDRQVRLIVPSSTGGTADILTRLIGQKLSEMWNQPVVVDNRPGGLGVVGGEALARSRPDGYTIGLLPSNHAVLTVVKKDLPYDGKKDFLPVATVAVTPGLLVVNDALAKARNAKEAFDIAKANQGKFNYASPVALTAGHRSMELLNHLTGARIQHVAYKGGAQAVTDLIGGQVQFLIIAIPSVIGHVKAGKLRALGVTTLTRFEGLPEVPTLAESGFPGFESVEWYGLFMPAGVPKARVDKVEADVRRLMSSPEMRDRLVAIGAVATPGGGADMARMFDREVALWTRLSADIKLQTD